MSYFPKLFSQIYLLIALCLGCSSDSSEHPSDPGSPKKNSLSVPDHKKLHFITYADETYARSRQRIVHEAKESGWFDEVEAHSSETIQDFRNLHSDFIQKNKRGGGYWIWKPYFILRKLETMRDGDFLVYLDSGCSINANGTERLTQYLNELANSESSVFGFEMSHLPEKCWTKADLFKELGSRMSQEIADSGQRLSGIIIFKKSPQSIAFVKEWQSLSVAASYHLIDDTASSQANDRCYKEHRHDQSIYSVLAKSYGMIAIPDETFTPEEGLEKGWPFLATRLR